MLDKRSTGKWLITLHKHLQEFSQSPELTYFDTTCRAAQCGRLLALIRKKELIGSERELVGMARSIKIPPSDLKLVILPELEKRGLVVVDRSRAGDIETVREFAPSENEILERTTDIWEMLSPQDEERAAVFSLEAASILPLTASVLEARLEQLGFGKDVIRTSLDLQRAFKLIKAQQFAGERELVFYNEYIFQENVERVVKYLRRLDPRERDLLEHIIDQVRLSQGLPIQDITGAPDQMLQAARSAGLLDVTRIHTTSGVERAFVFTPHFYTFGAKPDRPFDDTWDEVKLFVAHIIYGSRFAQPGTGRINDPIVLVEALLRNREIGPATAIGRDYPLLETHGIIQTRPYGQDTDRRYMQLVKDDVVERALKVLKYGNEGEIASGFTQSSSGLYVPGRFFSPEQDRLLLSAQLGAQAPAVAQVEKQLLTAWRGEEF